MNECYDKLISLLTCAMRGEAGEKNLPADMSDEDIKQLYEIASKHDLAHLVGEALAGMDQQEKVRYKPFFQAALMSVYRYEKLVSEQDKIFTILEKLEIPYIPLKGAVIRSLYREPWHRLSCDIDVLIPEESLEKAIGALEAELAYTRGKRSPHEVSLMSANGVHLELHFDIHEIYVDRSELWADARPLSDGSCQRVLSNEMLLLNHISHMAKHFVSGGCGLRPFLDLWLMREKLSIDNERLTSLMSSHGLAGFSKVAFGIVDVWFNGKVADETEMMTQAFILPAGVYGNLNNKISVTRAKGTNKFLYAVERIFPPRASLKIAYPIL